jgi:hypothetical protein
MAVPLDVTKTAAPETANGVMALCSTVIRGEAPETASSSALLKVNERGAFHLWDGSRLVRSAMP